MRNALLALLLAAPAVAAPAKTELETVVLEVLKNQNAPVAAPVKAKPVKSVVLAANKKVCRLTGMDRDNCLYKCSDGTSYSRPIDVEPAHPSDPFGSPRIACPQLVIPF